MDIKAVEELIKQGVFIVSIFIGVGVGVGAISYGWNKSRKEALIEKDEIVKEKDAQFEKLVGALKENLELIEEENKCMKTELEKLNGLVKKQTGEINKLKKDLEIYYCSNAPTCAKNSRRVDDIEKEIEI